LFKTIGEALHYKLGANARIIQYAQAEINEKMEAIYKKETQLFNNEQKIFDAHPEFFL